MENQTAVISASNSAPVKAAVICLILAWIFALLPIPFISMMGMIAMNIVAFILAVICLTKSAVKPGVGVLVGSLVVTPLMYFLGLAVLSAGLGGVIEGYNHRAAQVAQSKLQGQSSDVADASVNASDFAGKWKGQFSYSHGVKADFTLTLANPTGNVINGDMLEIDPNTKKSVSSIVSGEVTANTFHVTQKYSGQSQEAVCLGQYSASSKQLAGACTIGKQSAEFSAKKESRWL